MQDSEVPVLAKHNVVRRYDPTCSQEDVLRAAAAIVGGVFTYERVGYDQRAMRFNANGTVGLGAGGRETYWDVYPSGRCMVLELASDTEVTCRLAQDEHGAWRGRWLHAEKMPIAIYRSLATLHYDMPGETGVGGHAACATKVGMGGQFNAEYRAAVYAEDRGDFRSVRNSNVLIYFRHGLGDWASLSYILPLLDRSNRYWITRFGDDYTTVFDGSPYITPIYLGSNTIMCDDGNLYHNKHFGIDIDNANGSVQTLNLPLSLRDVCAANEIDTVLHLGYPEIHGLSRFPFHSKARFMLPYLVHDGSLVQEVLKRPLPSAINFTVNGWILDWVRSRLRNYGGFGSRRLCVISRNGYTVHGKNWGHKWREEMPEGKQREGEECRDFMRLLLQKDPRWMFLQMEDSMFQGDDTLRSEELHAYSFAELFGSVGQASFPFGILTKAILNLADISVGVPTGPYHLSMIKPDLPTIGIWIEHLPCWYDEPKPNSMHLVSRAVVEFGLDRRIGSFTDRAELHYPTRWLETRVVTGEQVLGAVETLLY